ncbi:MAG: LLM class F420-dependent oxidoreductase [Anaerolineales bacterium]|nr:LLM class F420-dependent oxidoreductase [Anaerolineales bacterium]
MRIGAVFPQTEFGHDPLAVRDFAQAAEELGYTHVVAYDHILGANPARPGGWAGPYTHESSFLEPFVLFAYMAAATTHLELAPGVIILPQRQTALVAKQAATLDALSGGRLRLGVGLGWNAIEYEALGQDFHTRGRRLEEQVSLLRQLWTQPLVTFTGAWHTVSDAGLNPLPIQCPIPIWFGASAEAAVRRAARLADGWMMTGVRIPEEALPSLAVLDRCLAEAGRSRSAFGVEARVGYGSADQAAWQRLVRGWESAGVTHLSLNTMGAGLSGPEAHLRALRTFAAAMGLSR